MWLHQNPASPFSMPTPRLQEKQYIRQEAQQLFRAHRGTTDPVEAHKNVRAGAGASGWRGFWCGDWGRGGELTVMLSLLP